MNLTYTPETCVGSSETATLLLLAWARDPQPSSLPSPGPTAHVRNDNRAQLRKTNAAEFPRNFLGGHCNFAEYFFEGPCALLSVCVFPLLRLSRGSRLEDAVEETKPSGFSSCEIDYYRDSVLSTANNTHSCFHCHYNCLYIPAIYCIILHTLSS